MPTDAFEARPLSSPLTIPPGNKPVLVASLARLPAGSYALFVKMTVVTRVDSTGRDDARGGFSLEAGGRVDKTLYALAHAGFPQPVDTICLQLVATVLGPARRRPAAVKVFCQTGFGIVEIVNLVITAIRLDTARLF